MKCEDFHNLSPCELTMLAATTATNLTEGLNLEEINELQNFLHLLDANINAIKCSQFFLINCPNKKDGFKPPCH